MRYPLFLELNGEKAVVVGGGKVATRKVRLLLKAGAALTVVSPVASPSIRRWADRGEVCWKARRYRQGDLRGARLAVAATDDLTLNERIAAAARRERILVNCIAPPAAGDFIVPASIERGGMTLAISTDGASPALAKRLRLDLERFLDAQYPDLGCRLAKLAKKRRAPSG